MIAIYAQDLESAQRLALKRGIPCGMWEFVCSESKFNGIEHTTNLSDIEAAKELAMLQRMGLV